MRAGIPVDCASGSEKKPAVYIFLQNSTAAEFRSSYMRQQKLTGSSTPRTTSSTRNVRVFNAEIRYYDGFVDIEIDVILMNNIYLVLTGFWENLLSRFYL